MADEVSIIKGGTFSLDPGAAFGTTPRIVWSRFVQTNDQYRIQMDTNLLLATAGGKKILIDSGIGSHHDERFAGLFQVNPRKDLANVLMRESENLPDVVVHTHLHFDHAGNSLDIASRKKDVVLIAQEIEKKELSTHNELTSVSYEAMRPLKARLKTVRGNSKITSSLSVIHTGGHTAGHQSVILESGNRKFLYFGDIAPTHFNVKPSRITGIDTFPLDTLKWKKKLIMRAIRENMVCVFGHDTVMPAATLSGSLEKIEVTPFDISTY